MRKKSFAGLLLALSISLTSLCAFANEPGAPILLNQRTLHYEDTAPVTINGRTLVPLNKFFSFANICANYYESDKKIIVDSYDNKKRIALYLDDPVMQVYTYKTILQSERKDVNLDVSAQLINDTVMCPLRAVLEELGIEVLWDDASQTITINTLTPAKAEDVPCLKLYTDATDINAGDEVEVYITISNYEKYKENYSLAGITNTIKYNKSEFSYESVEFVPEKQASIGINAANGDFLNYGAKFVCLVNNFPLEQDEIKCAKVTFKALTDNGGILALSNGFNILRGSDNSVLFQDAEYKTIVIEDITQLYLDTTPIVIK